MSFMCWELAILHKIKHTPFPIRKSLNKLSYRHVEWRNYYYLWSLSRFLNTNIYQYIVLYYHHHHYYWITIVITCLYNDCCQFNYANKSVKILNPFGKICFESSLLILNVFISHRRWQYSNLPSQTHPPHALLTSLTTVHFISWSCWYKPIHYTIYSLWYKINETSAKAWCVRVQIQFTLKLILYLYLYTFGKFSFHGNSYKCFIVRVVFSWKLIESGFFPSPFFQIKYLESVLPQLLCYVMH